MNITDDDIQMQLITNIKNDSNESLYSLREYNIPELIKGGKNEVAIPIPIK